MKQVLTFSDIAKLSVRQQKSFAERRRLAESKEGRALALSLLAAMVSSRVSASMKEAVADDLAALPVADSVDDLIAFGEICVETNEIASGAGADHDHAETGHAWRLAGQHGPGLAGSPFASRFANRLGVADHANHEPTACAAAPAEVGHGAVHGAQAASAHAAAGHGGHAGHDGGAGGEAMALGHGGHEVAAGPDTAHDGHEPGEENAGHDHARDAGAPAHAAHESQAQGGFAHSHAAAPARPAHHSGQGDLGEHAGPNEAAPAIAGAAYTEHGHEHGDVGQAGDEPPFLDALLPAGGDGRKAADESDIYALFDLPPADDLPSALPVV